MVMLRLRVGSLGLSALFLLCSAFVLTGHPSGEDDSKAHEKEVSISDLTHLKLNSDQAEKIGGLKEDFEQEFERLRGQAFKMRTELKLLWMQPHPDRQQIMEKERAIHDLNWQMKEISVDYRLSFRNILTPEQLAEYLKRGEDYHRNHRKE